MIREVHTLIVFGKEYKVGDLKRSDFLLLCTRYDQALLNILSEFNETIPTLNARQERELLDFLLEIIHKQKKPTKPQEGENQDTIKQLLIIEGQIMQHLHQPLGEIRDWTLNYVMQMYDVLPEILDYTKSNEKLDKKALKENLGQFYKK
ncbi:MAG: hypothetical protein LBG52_01685 [Candidatus Peribacteria bacterium]|jgi:hypothetical protein|nr:hypothetical protein [Candidatus Peribacteria bacterium]